jgi:putative transposase
MRVRSLNHSVYQLQYHIVWGTKYRRKFIIPVVKAELLHSLYETIKKYPTLHIFLVNANRDHVHVQIEIPPSILISSVVQKLKAVSSFYLRKRFKFVREMYLEKEGIWSVGYFVSSIGLNEENIRKYIAWQDKHEMPQTIRPFHQPSKQSRFGLS